MVTCQSLGQTLRNSHTFPAYEPTLFEVEVTNKIQIHLNQELLVGMFALEKVTNVCISQSIKDDGDIEIPVMSGGEIEVNLRAKAFLSQWNQRNNYCHFPI